MPQDHLEPVLLSHLRSLGAARVEFGSEVVAVESDAGRRARDAARDRASGRVRIVRARYLVGADGARSSVRAALGIAMRGPDRLEEAVAVQFRAPLWDLLGDPRYGVYNVMHPEAGGRLPAGRARATAGSTGGSGSRVASAARRAQPASASAS